MAAHGQKQAVRDGAAQTSRRGERVRAERQTAERERTERRRAHAERRRQREAREAVDDTELWVYRELLDLPPTTGGSYVDRHQRVFTTTDGRRWRIEPALGDCSPETGGEQYSCRANRTASRRRTADSDPDAYRKDAWGRRRCDIPPVSGPTRRGD